MFQKLLAKIANELRNTMKITNILGIGVLLAVALCSSACTIESARETPVVRVVRQYAPTVVNIRTENVLDLKELPEWGRYGEELDSFFKEYYGEIYSEGTLKYKSLGSGVILGTDGLIVTNAHVVQKATDIFVVLKDGTVLDAAVVKVSPGDDLAIIKTELPYLVKGVQFADSKDLMIGETVIAIGNPLGLENSVTVGVVSGKDRAFASPECGYVCTGLVQTDASINPGNSGGALLNLDGELVGINVAVVQDAQNIGFAIPAVKIEKLLEAIE
jgi:serine protease Do